MVTLHSLCLLPRASSCTILGHGEDEEQPTDSIQSIIDDHKRRDGYFRAVPTRPVLVPHKITFGDVFGDLSHMALNRRRPAQSIPTTMHLSDLNANKRRLHEVEFVQLLSSLVVRGIQLHRKHDRFIPRPFLSTVVFPHIFPGVLTVSQMPLHSSTDPLPFIHQRERAASELARIRADAQTKATREGEHTCRQSAYLVRGR